MRRADRLFDIIQTGDFRNFRVDRIIGSQLLDEKFEANSGQLMAQWLALPKDHSRAAA